jgi:hypothetical protein
MKIVMQIGDIPNKLSYSRWNIAFVGIPLDERGEKSIEFLRSYADKVIPFQYFNKEFEIKLMDDVFDIDDVEEKLTAYSSENIIIDTTTMSFSEILILCQSFKNLEIKDITLLYIEPIRYKHKSLGNGILERRGFELSDEISGYEAIPGHALSLSNDVNQKVVFLCGFESERIDRALEDTKIVSSNCCSIFGVPAFCPGWEMDSFDNNISVFKDRKITGNINFCGATNPLAVFQTLEAIYNGLDKDGQLFIVPIGTKPMSIGASLFLISKPKDKVAVLYDHPKKMKGRTIEISNWHLFNISF